MRLDVDTVEQAILKRQLAALEREYRERVRPIVARLVEIEATRWPRLVLPATTIE